MKCLFFALMLLASGNAAASNVDDFLKGLGEIGANKNTAPASQLFDQDINRGLKDALAEGADKAVSLLGRPDGFLKNDKVRSMTVSPARLPRQA